MSSESGQIYIFDIETGALSIAFTSYAMSVHSVAWSPDSTVCVLFQLHSPKRKKIFTRKFELN